MDDNIKIPQEGCFPLFIRFVGILVFLIIIISGIQEIINGTQNLSENFFSGQHKSETIRLLIIAVLLIPFSAIILEFIGGLFPSIRIDKKGFLYRRSFITRRVSWNEIEYIAKIKWPFDCYAIVYSRKPNSFFDLWIGSLNGRLARLSKPAIFLSTSREQRNQLAKFIQKNQEVQSWRTNKVLGPDTMD